MDNIIECTLLNDIVFKRVDSTFRCQFTQEEIQQLLDFYNNITGCNVTISRHTVARFEKLRGQEILYSELPLYYVIALVDILRYNNELKNQLPSDLFIKLHNYYNINVVSIPSCTHHPELLLAMTAMFLPINDNRGIAFEPNSRTGLFQGFSVVPHDQFVTLDSLLKTKFHNELFGEAPMLYYSNIDKTVVVSKMIYTDDFEQFNYCYRLPEQPDKLEGVTKHIVQKLL